MIGVALGGIGLFLLGMALLTDGLQLAAGDRLRHALRRYTRSRPSSVTTGAVATAVVQSSSAITLLTIGFVGAGLLSLPSALGVVFGANVGTTVTAWIVAGVGLKLKMETAALPLVGVGALVRLFTRGRRAAIGTALAGFGLVFVGIGVLQRGMAGAAARIDLAHFAGEGPLTLLLLALIGALMTVVMQSSSAAVATTLAAVDGGTIGLLQAAALVIGQNVGTTVTAGIGSIGGSAAVRRTALAHLIFNLVTGLVAFGLLPLLWLVAGEQLAQREPAIVVSAFHTAFNVVGVIIFLPFIKRLASWLERRIPDQGAALTRRLATGRSASAAAVLEACRRTGHDIAAAALQAAIALIRAPDDEVPDPALTDVIAAALDATRDKLRTLQGTPEASDEHRRHVATLHAIDHLYRFQEALCEQRHGVVCRRHAIAEAPTADLVSHFEELAAWAATQDGPPPDTVALSSSLADIRRAARPKILERTASGDLDPHEGERLLEAMRWIDRLAYHSARAHHHLERADHIIPLPPPPAPRSQGRRGDESYEAQA